MRTKLAVDDDVFCLDIFEDIILEAGYEVVTVLRYEAN